MSKYAKRDAQKRQRKERVQTIKKTIVLLLAAGILVPNLLCVVLFIKIHQLEKGIQQLQIAAPKPDVLAKENQVDLQKALEGMTSEEEMWYSADYEQTDEANVLEEDSTEIRKVYLTFDDGPTPRTNQILDILAEYDVKATFFVVGRPDEIYKPVYQRIVDEGHTIGMHSYSHKYEEIYQSEEHFIEDMQALQEYIYETTGTWSHIYRFPGGSSNRAGTLDMHTLAQYLYEEDITYFDWNVAAGDAVATSVPATQIAANVIGRVKGLQTSMVLLHEGDNKSTTIEALPIIIKTLQDMGNVAFLPITDDTPKIQHLKIDEK